MSERCLVCGGAKVVRLPLRREVSAMFPGPSEIPSKAEETSRTYPCPECAETVTEAQVLVIGAAQSVDARHLAAEGAEVRKYVHRGMANMIAEHMLKERVISFSERAQDRDVFGDAVEFRARVGVVSRAATETIEKRVYETAAKALDVVVERAAERIRVWRGYNSGDEGRISKGEAVYYLKEAFNDYLAEMRGKITGSQDGK